VFVLQVPVNILALPRAIVRSKASHALPTRPALAEGAGPTATTDAPLLEHAAHLAVQGEPGGADYGCQCPSRAPADDPTYHHPRPGGVPKRLKDVLGHGVEPPKSRVSICDERSDEKKVVSYKVGIYIAVASLQPSDQLSVLRSSSNLTSSRSRKGGTVWWGQGVGGAARLAVQAVKG